MVVRRGAGPLVIAAAAFLPAEAWACSVCVGWTEGQGLNGGFYWSALLLTLLPFTVVAVIGAWLGYAFRRVRSRPATGDPPFAIKQRPSQRAGKGVEGDESLTL